jgi:hypothetical protein
MRTKLTSEEAEYFDKSIREIRLRLPHPISPSDEVEIYWNDKYGVDNGILGSFNWIRPDEVDLSPLGKDSPELLVSTFAHELHHRWQYKTYKVLYCLALVPIVRQFLLEKTAKEVELAADDLLGLGGFGE